MQLTDRYAIVTTEYYYDGYDEKREYENFQEYTDYETFETQVRNLTLLQERFRAFRITPVTVTTTVTINIGQ